MYAQFVTLAFHNAPEAPVASIAPTIDGFHFGKITISAPLNMAVDSRPCLLFFNIDRSGSMEEVGNDGRTRIYHVIHTVSNILRAVIVNGGVYYVHVQAFDDGIETIIETVLITKENVEELISKIHTLNAQGSTNIGRALDRSCEIIAKYNIDFPGHRVAHFFLSDGDATVGEHDPDILIDKIPSPKHESCCINILFGMGDQHNSVMLQKAANRQPGDAYYFIANADKAGLAYGDATSSIFHPALENVTIRVLEGDGEVYDTRKNTWVTEVNVGPIDSEMTKHYYIRTMDKYRCEINVSGLNCCDNEFVTFEEDVDSIPDLEDVDGNICPPFNDFSRDLFRLETLSLLFQCSKTAFTQRKSMRKQLAGFFRQMRQYMRSVDFMDDPVMIRLCDDIVVAYKIVGTNLGKMHCGARGASQGSQRAYTTECDVDDHCYMAPPDLHRQSHIHRSINRQINTSLEYDDDTEPFPQLVFYPPINLLTQDIISIDDEGNDTLCPPDDDTEPFPQLGLYPPTDPLTRDTISIDDEGNDIVCPSDDDFGSLSLQTEDDIRVYMRKQKRLKENSDTNIDDMAYMTPGRQQTMRAVSGV